VRDISQINIYFLERVFPSLLEMMLAAIARSSPGSERESPREILA